MKGKNPGVGVGGGGGVEETLDNLSSLMETESEKRMGTCWKPW